MLEFDLNNTSHLLALAGAAAVAGLVRGFAGFAGPATISLLLAHFFTPATLIPRIAAMDIYAYPILVWNARKHANWRLAFPIAAACVSCMPFGVYTLSVLDGEILKRLIGIACIGAVAVSMSDFRFKAVPPLWMSLIVAAVLGWLMAATFIALPIVTYIVLMPYPAAVCRATVIAFSVMTTPFLFVMLVLADLVNLSDLGPLALCGGVYFTMIAVGSRLFLKASERDYRRAAQWLILILAVMVLI